MTERTLPYTEIRHRLRQKLRCEQACIGQAADLPAPDMVARWALQLEVFRRLEDARPGATSPTCTIILEWLYASSMPAATSSTQRPAAGDTRRLRCLDEPTLTR
jgi:hypothetical protein